MNNHLKYSLFIIAIIMLASCGVPNRSILKGTYDGKDFILKGKIDMLSRHGERMDCAQGVSFYPAYPLGDQMSFTFGFKGVDMYQGLKEHINNNLLLSQENRMDDFYILGYRNKAIEINIGDAPEGDFFIIEKVELQRKRFRSNFKELNEAVVLKGVMKLHFDEVIIDADFKLVFGQCYKSSFEE